MIYFSHLEHVTTGKILRVGVDQGITNLLTDSRKATPGNGALFFAITGAHHDGHHFIEDLYFLGIRQFIVERHVPYLEDKTDVNILIAPSSIAVLQDIVAYHRSLLAVPVVGITGSNGKTIVKEWLYQLLSSDHKIAKNPGSYNSQIGVPLSVWQLQSHHDLGIFEAGISRPLEMENLARVVHPTIGIFTNLGPAHDEGFSSLQQKLMEKLKLFESTKLLIYCNDHQTIRETIEKSKLSTLSWGSSSTASIHVKGKGNTYSISFKGSSFSLTFPFHDKASVENCFHCIALLLHLGYNGAEIQERISTLQSVPMRMELKDGINQSQIIDDTYNNDLAGLQISLDFLLHQHQKNRKRLILSEILESGHSSEDMARETASMIAKYHLDAFVGIGKSFQKHAHFFSETALLFESTDDFLQHFDWDAIHDEIVLVKGARRVRGERIIARMQRKVHGTVMEINLGALIKNLNYFKGLLKPSTKIMAMVKAFAYGSGSAEIANLLQYHKVDYLGVAYTDEGVELRKNNIALPIMVMSPTEESFGLLLHYRLEPEIYSFKILQDLIAFARGRQITIHLKLDTGMHRLGFNETDIQQLCDLLTLHPHLKVASIFSHLAGADENTHDAFSKDQASRFQGMASKIIGALPNKPLLHILNSPGILRLSEFQFDMVRLGIGLYGIDPTAENNANLHPVATLKTIVSQIKHLQAGETIGYGRKGTLAKNAAIATIAIGYADGFSRAFSCGVGKVMINGQPAPVIGNVCMDMTMVDITGLTVNEGDEVIVFGPERPISEVAAAINTIPYEILTNTSERVKRIFVAESI